MLGGRWEDAELLTDLFFRLWSKRREAQGPLCSPEGIFLYNM